MSSARHRSGERGVETVPGGFFPPKKKEVALFFLLVMADRNQLRRRLLQTQNIRFERSSSRTSTQFRSLMK